jgi:hypothetical protein
MFGSARNSTEIDMSVSSKKHALQRVFNAAKEYMDAQGCGWDEAWNAIIRTGKISVTAPQRTTAANEETKMDLHEILRDPAVLELQRLSRDLQQHPERLNAPGTPGLTFPEAYHSTWKSARGQELQKQLRSRWGDISLIPLPDGSVAVSAAGSGGSGQPWGGTSPAGQGQLNVPHSQTDQSEIAAKARSEGCKAAVRQVMAAHPAMSFEEAWKVAAAQSPSLFRSKGADDDFDADDYQLRHVYGVRK